MHPLSLSSATNELPQPSCVSQDSSTEEEEEKGEEEEGGGRGEGSSSRRRSGRSAGKTAVGLRFVYAVSGFAICSLGRVNCDVRVAMYDLWLAFCEWGIVVRGGRFVICELRFAVL